MEKSCGCENCKDHSGGELEKGKNKSNINIYVGIILFIITMFFINDNFKFWGYLFVYFFIGSSIILKAKDSLMGGFYMDENVLMIIATLAAFFVGEYPEAIAVVLLYRIGEYFQDKAVYSSRKKISDLMNIKPEIAHVFLDGKIEDISPESVKIGDVLIVKTGEKIPVDSRVIEGFTNIDSSSMTGESLPIYVSKGDKLVSGTVNIGSLIKIKAIEAYENSTVSRVLDLIENASSKKSKTEKRITKFARIYTPIVVILASITAIIPPLFFGQEFNVWIYRAAIFLVISCPCALVISVPLGYFAGIGKASNEGILVKGSNYFDSISNIKTIFFDKTGTLTKGNFVLKKIFTTKDFSENEILKYAYSLELFSNHPIAKAISNEFKDGEPYKIEKLNEIPGVGISGISGGKKIFLGNKKIFEKTNEIVEEIEFSGTLIYLIIDDVYKGAIGFSDEIRDESYGLIKNLKKRNIKSYMVTGDRKSSANQVSKELGIEDYYYELLPDEKLRVVEKVILENNGRVAFLGDGINDAPVIARSDVGIAMGGIGSDVAIEAADVVIMNDKVEKLFRLIDITRKTKKVVDINIIFSIGVKVIVLALAFLGFTSMWLAIFADVGVSLIAVLNSISIIGWKS